MSSIVNKMPETVSLTDHQIWQIDGQIDKFDKFKSYLNMVNNIIIHS